MNSRASKIVKLKRVLMDNYIPVKEFIQEYEVKYSVDHVYTQIYGYMRGKHMSLSTLYKVIDLLKDMTGIDYTPNDLLDYEKETNI